MPFTQTNDIQTFYEIHGEGLPLVLIHGGLVDHQMWQPQVEPFSRKYRVITYGIRGHGRTGGSEKREYSVQLLAEDLRTFDTAEMAKIYKLLVRFRTPELEKIEVSTLIINGEHESHSVFRHAEYLQIHIPNTQVTTIPGAGHLSNVENPEAFNVRVLSFLEGVKAA